jgi:hypothetical protein
VLTADEAEADLQARAAAEALHAPLFRHAQEFRLRYRRQVADSSRKSVPWLASRRVAQREKARARKKTLTRTAVGAPRSSHLNVSFRRLLNSWTIRATTSFAGPCRIDDQDDKSVGDRANGLEDHHHLLSAR